MNSSSRPTARTLPLENTTESYKQIESINNNTRHPQTTQTNHHSPQSNSYSHTLRSAQRSRASASLQHAAKMAKKKKEHQLNDAIHQNTAPPPDHQQPIHFPSYQDSTKPMDESEFIALRQRIRASADANTLMQQSAIGPFNIITPGSYYNNNNDNTNNNTNNDDDDDGHSVILHNNNYNTMTTPSVFSSDRNSDVVLHNDMFSFDTHSYYHQRQHTTTAQQHQTAEDYYDNTDNTDDDDDDDNESNVEIDLSEYTDNNHHYNNTSIDNGDDNDKSENNFIDNNNTHEDNEYDEQQLYNTIDGSGDATGYYNNEYNHIHDHTDYHYNDDDDNSQLPSERDTPPQQQHYNINNTNNNNNVYEALEQEKRVNAILLQQLRIAEQRAIEAETLVNLTHTNLQHSISKQQHAATVLASSSLPPLHVDPGNFDGLLTALQEERTRCAGMIFDVNAANEGKLSAEVELAAAQHEISMLKARCRALQKQSTVPDAFALCEKALESLHREVLVLKKENAKLMESVMKNEVDAILLCSSGGGGGGASQEGKENNNNGSNTAAANNNKDISSDTNYNNTNNIINSDLSPSSTIISKLHKKLQSSFAQIRKLRDDLASKDHAMHALQRSTHKVDVYRRASEDAVRRNAVLHEQIHDLERQLEAQCLTAAEAMAHVHYDDNDSNGGGGNDNVTATMNDNNSQTQGYYCQYASSTPLPSQGYTPISYRHPPAQHSISFA